MAIKDPVRIWAPRIGAGTDEDPCRPDIPEGVAFTTDALPRDRDPDSPHYMRHVCRYYPIIVEKKDVPKCVNRIPDDQVPERDRLLCEMIRRCFKDWDGQAENFFESVADNGNASPERKRIMAELLKRARLRGLSDVCAERIRARHNLSSGG